ncbi:MAG: nucleotidyltransferase family protein [Oscillospiraceae bacterium]|nr:nucleotidyltransferase family protein [Oscillospiraceae bacterium]
MKNPNIGCVVMAAGNASRFGANKLLEPIGGKPIIHHALSAIPAELFSSVVVVTQYEAVGNIAKEFNFTTIRNTQPELGVSHTIQLGIEALSACDAICFAVADQPLLRRESVAALVALHGKNRDKIAALASDGTRGNPCIFPARFFPALMALTGDRGGRSVIRANEDALVLLEAQPQELWDIDTPDALRILQEGF